MGDFTRVNAMKRLSRQRKGRMIFALLTAGFFGGCFGVLLGIIIANLWLSDGSIQQALRETVEDKIWIPACGGGIGGAIGVWWGWSMVRLSRNDIDKTTV